MDLVVTLAATIDELAGVDDRYERELLHVLESVAAELDKLNSDDRRAFAAHVEAMSARAAADPLVSADIASSSASFRLRSAASEPGWAGRAYRRPVTMIATARLSMPLPPRRSPSAVSRSASRSVVASMRRVPGRLRTGAVSEAPARAGPS